MICLPWIAAAVCIFLVVQSLLISSITRPAYGNPNANTHPSRYLLDQDKGTRHMTSSLVETRNNRPFALRILPLGASITWGFRSPDGNGYREFLRDNLTSNGWEVDMIGSLRHGTMRDNENEGHPGWRIDQIAAHVEPILYQQPNIILINAGTNDAIQNYNVSTVGERMGKLLDNLYKAVPGTTIILSTLLPNKLVPHTVVNISQQFRDIVETRQNSGERIVLAEMSNGTITASNLVDMTHPDEQGYYEMAQIWGTAINEADLKEFLSKPADSKGVNTSNTGCSANYLRTKIRGLILAVIIPLWFITIAAGLV